MNNSLKRIGAIFIKELQDIKTNANVIFMYLIPILFVVIYENFVPGMPAGFALGFSLLFLASLVGMYVPSMTIAEEKEKKTMQVLMLSPARPLEVFAGKGLLTFITMVACTIVMMLLSKGGFDHGATVLASSVLVFILCIFIGMIVGLLSSNQMSTGIVGFPIYMIFIMVPIFATTGSSVMVKIAKFLPTYYYFHALNQAYTQNKTFSDLLPEMGYIILGIAVATIILLLVYRKKGIE